MTPIRGWTIAVLAFLAIYGSNLQFPHTLYYDEVYQVKTAQQITQLSGYTETSHPPFAMLLMAGSILIFGDHSWAWRLPSLLSGLGSVLLVFAITRRFSKNNRLAFFAAFIFFFDGLSFTQARIGMLNATTLFFMLLSVWCLLHLEDNSWPMKKALFLSGISFGLAAASRWVGFSIAPLLGIFLWRSLQKSENKSVWFKDFFLYFKLPVVCAYFAPFLIFPFLKGYDWHALWTTQTHMLRYHLTLTEGHTYGSEWWSWQMMTRPIWYFFERSADGVRGILCIGNPMVFWVLPLAVVYAIYAKVDKKGMWFAQFALAGLLTLWLPWAFVSRVKFFHYFYTALPFGAMLLAIGLEKLWSQGSWGRWVVISYLVGVAALFFYWYPLLNGLPISSSYYERHLWFKSWV